MPSSTAKPAKTQPRKPLKHCNDKATVQGYPTFKDKVHYFGKYGTPESRMKYLRFMQDIEKNAWELPSEYMDKPIKVKDKPKFKTESRREFIDITKVSDWVTASAIEAAKLAGMTHEVDANRETTSTGSKPRSKNDER